jgi:6-pyruvoyltetrahydropterin/6-carboxytetrahydropterin synthase
MTQYLYAHREHEIAIGHRVHNHESKCAHIHGHNLLITFFCRAPKLDSVGRVIDFSVIKSTLVEWIENNWDHKSLFWEEDPVIKSMWENLEGMPLDYAKFIEKSIVWVPFNPTSENIANYLLHNVGPRTLKGTGVELVRVTVMETRKCGVTMEL